MKLVINRNVSNKINNQIIKFFNIYNNLKIFILPKSTKNRKDYLNQIKSPSVNFKEKIVVIYSETNFSLLSIDFSCHLSIITIIKSNQLFYFKNKCEKKKNLRIFNKQYECDW